MLTKLLEPEFLAARWKIRLETLSQWRWNGKGPKFLKMGNNIFYRITDVEAYEAHKAKKSTSEIYDFDIEPSFEHKSTRLDRAFNKIKSARKGGGK